MTESDQTSEIPLYKVLGEIVALWTLANIGYYFLLPTLGYDISYNASPIVIAIYFSLWTLICIANFWDIYKLWFTPDKKLWLYILGSFAGAGCLFGAIYLFSLLPSIHGPFAPYTDILFATPWYFLPKAVEVLVQQLLVSALILALYFRFHTLKQVVIGYALCFGGAHILLFLLDKAPTPYAILMTVSAVLTSFIFPYCILKIRGGFIVTYMIHILFYVLLAAVLHILTPVGYLF